MSKPALWFCLLSAIVIPAGAQVTVELRSDQEQYLPGEAVQTAVRITNRSGQLLRLGSDEDWLVFSAESPDGRLVPKVSEPMVQGEFELPSGKVATKRVNVEPHFPFDKPGRFLITATVKISQWGIEKASTPKAIDIVEGAKLWQQDVGLPSAGNEAPEIRRYMLQQVNYLKGQLRLYLRVINPADGKTLRVAPIGKTLSFSRPEAQVDGVSNLHVLFQNGPQAFSYTKYSPAGELLERKTFDYIETRPRFQFVGNEIAVKGGVRRVHPSDFPPEKPEETKQEEDSHPSAAAAADEKVPESVTKE